jgi:hypothetical protein
MAPLPPILNASAGTCTEPHSAKEDVMERRYATDTGIFESWADRLPGLLAAVVFTLVNAILLGGVIAMVNDYGAAYALAAPDSAGTAMSARKAVPMTASDCKNAEAAAPRPT